ncbi:sulfatase-like hydrolase/transferase [Seonamhaeicola marinus]|uniref:Sulfatase-like hydrolase/transferase n=1 Tax=Seonamhaeicola marinus TaxID=1912246 RepID=A0A5D0HWW2_9FLAO|nr:sulfatase-like hydrolase/transferase [Seonamhaeicola marinus]TYA74627.1 sulfatase-like hydrolase/transferase [Seonamhaeicola marinus]
MRKLLMLNLLVAVTLQLNAQRKTSKHEQPNVIVILADDLGWADVGFNGSTDIPTPNLDMLARDGVSFTAGYATHSYCGPSRAGLLAGRYQQRFGCENNIGKGFEGPVMGLPLEQTILSEVLQDNGYQTCAIGKWHLGHTPEYWPNNRGFDDWFGFSGGSRNYWGKSWEKSFTTWHQIMRNGQPEPLENLSYLTDDFSKAAVEYIDTYSKSKKPFFMYLAYNAPHAPIQATKAYINNVDHIEQGERAAYAAMVSGMDVGIGRVIEKLKETGEYENTLIFFYSDNGGHGKGSSQSPYRGQKGLLFEGGIRVPFLMSWPAGFKGGTRYEAPIIGYDVFATVINAANIDYKKADQLDGANLLPFVKGEKTTTPHNKLFWRYSDGAGYCVRKGNYKLVKEEVRGERFLFDLKNDPYEQKNLLKTMPEKVAELQSDYENWNKDNVGNLWPDPHLPNIHKMKNARELIMKKTSGGENNY